MVAEIDGKKAPDIFLQKWKRDAASFAPDHYKDVIDYLFVEHHSDQVVVGVYLDVPRSYDEIRGYKPKIEYWLIKIG